MVRLCLHCGIRFEAESGRCPECGTDAKGIRQALAKIRVSGRPSLSGFERLALGVAVVLSVLGCIAAFLGGIVTFFLLLGDGVFLSVLWLVGSALSFLYAYAMYVLFRRAMES